MASDLSPGSQGPLEGGATSAGAEGSDSATVAIGGALVGPPPGSIASLVGTPLGRYLVIEELGRGGMGVVLRAYDPKLQREVALKLVRTDLLGAVAQARLVREARAMARLAHPNVVAVYDVETEDDDERVVVVMEYVEGQTLQQWLDAAARTPAQILAAFVAAGRGLAAAHAEQLLHRDFKPDNVLVGSDGQGPAATGRIRVTDFGLARGTEVTGAEDLAGPVGSSSRDGASGAVATGDGFSDALTAAGTVMGTPKYMAPEQFAAEDLDARTDQYALCVSLWRALTGKWPFDGRDRAALMKAKCEDPPRWPSDTTVPRHVAAAIRRGLSPVPANRWPDLPSLLAELERDPGQRGRRLLGVGAVLAVGVGVWGWQRVQRARSLHECVVAGAAIEAVYDEARGDRIGRAFAATGLSYAADTWSRSRARLARLSTEWADTRQQVCERAEVERSMPVELAAAAVTCLDEHRDALEALLDQLEAPDASAVAKAASASASLPVLSPCTDPLWLRLRVDPPDDPALRDGVRSLRRRLSEVAAARAIGRYDRASTEARAVLADATQLGWSPLVSEVKLVVGELAGTLAHHEDGRVLLEEVFFEAASTGRDELALDAASALTFTVGHDLARHDEGLAWGRLAQSFAARQGRGDDADSARVLSNLAAVHDAKGDYAEAQRLQERALGIWENVLGPDHPQVAMALNNLALGLHNQGEYARARTLSTRALAIWEVALGPEHPNVAMALNNLGNTLHSMGDYPQAQALHGRALAIREGAFGPEHPAVAASLANLGNALHLQGDSEAARASFERALSIWEKALGPEHPDLVGVLSNIGIVLATQGDFARAQELFERSIALGEKSLGPEHPEVARPLYQLGQLLDEQGHHAGAIAPLTRALAIFVAAVGTDHPDSAGAQFVLARALWGSGGDRARAQALAAEAAGTYRAAGEVAAAELDDVLRWQRSHPADAR
jgi:serine/threonine-protein kinase